MSTRSNRPFVQDDLLGTDARGAPQHKSPNRRLTVVT
jgi:hypothetical protein